MRFDLRPAKRWPRGTKITGSRFYVLNGAGARLQRALIAFMLDLHIEEHGLSETWTPVLVKPEMMHDYSTFESSMDETAPAEYLIPANLLANATRYAPADTPPMLTGSQLADKVELRSFCGGGITSDSGCPDKARDMSGAGP